MVSKALSDTYPQPSGSSPQLISPANIILTSTPLIFCLRLATSRPSIRDGSVARSLTVLTDSRTILTNASSSSQHALSNKDSVSSPILFRPAMISLTLSGLPPCLANKASSSSTRFLTICLLLLPVGMIDKYPI